jgi:guanylate kinase
MIKPLILSGPSGVGKSYLEKYLIRNHNFKRILSVTTRQIRKNEVNMVDYEFISEDKYLELEKQNQFITSLTNINAHYGIRKNLVKKIIAENKTPICVIVPQIIHTFVTAYPDTIAVFLKPINNDLLIKRMKLRGDSEEQIQNRLTHTLKEIDEYEKIKHLYKTSITVTETNFNETISTLLKLL